MKEQPGNRKEQTGTEKLIHAATVGTLEVEGRYSG